MKSQPKTPRATRRTTRAKAAPPQTLPDKKSILRNPTSSPIKQVPQEILSLVFTLYLLFQTTDRQRRDAPLLLIQVSRYWRDTALSNPRLWAVIHIHIDEQHPKVNASTVSTWLQRSRRAPLQIFVTNCTENHGVWDGNDALSLLVAQVSRWQSPTCELHSEDGERILKAVGPGGFPVLEQLVLKRPTAHPFSGRHDVHGSLSLPLCPKLSRIMYEYYPGLDLPVSKDDPLYTLEHVKGDIATSLPDCLQIIRNSPSLRVLHAQVFGDVYLQGPQPTSTHSFITELKFRLSSNDQGIDQFLDSVTLPSLKHLEIGFEWPIESEWTDALPRFMERSSPPLEQLHVDQCDGPVMHKTLCFAPNLRKLASWLDADEAAQYLTCKHPPPSTKATLDIAPHLKHLTLRCHEWTCSSSLADMVRSRWGGPSGLFPKEGKLRSIRILYDVRSIDEEDLEAIMEELEVYVSEGLKITTKNDT